MSLEDLLSAHHKTKRVIADSGVSRDHFYVPLPRLRSAHDDDSGMKLAPSYRALEEDEKHQQPIEMMSDYESRLIKKEALRNPLAEAEPDEDTPAGLRRRQLCFNLGNPYKKSTSKVCLFTLLMRLYTYNEWSTLCNMQSDKQRVPR